jgi:hypothetical protein
VEAQVNDRVAAERTKSGGLLKFAGTTTDLLWNLGRSCAEECHHLGRVDVRAVGVYRDQRVQAHLTKRTKPYSAASGSRRNPAAVMMASTTPLNPTTSGGGCTTGQERR